MENKRNFNRGPRFGGNRGGFGRGPRQMYPAKCSECGKDCEVPFKPDPDRPVYCRDCWAKKREEPRGFERRERKDEEVKEPEEEDEKVEDTEDDEDFDEKEDEEE